MSLYKRGKTWHTDFTVNGERFRQSLDTTDWREAQSSEKRLIADAEAAGTHRHAEATAAAAVTAAAVVAAVLDVVAGLPIVGAQGDPSSAR